MISAQSAGAYLLRIAQQSGEGLSNLQLQKLLYYAQGWHLGMYGTPLFPERIEAWSHGPVCPPEYGRWKSFEERAISEPVAAPRLEPDKAEFLREIFTKYRGLSAGELRNTTHRELPWRAARPGLPDNAPSNAVISHASMIQFFGALSFGNSEYQDYVRERVRLSRDSLGVRESIPHDEIDWTTLTRE